MKHPFIAKVAVFLGASFLLTRYLYSHFNSAIEVKAKKAARIDHKGHYDIDGVSHDQDMGTIIAGGLKSSNGVHVS